MVNHRCTQRPRGADDTQRWAQPGPPRPAWWPHRAPAGPPPPRRATPRPTDQAHTEPAAAGRPDTLLGSALLQLAARIDANGMDTDSSPASMVK